MALSKFQIYSIIMWLTYIIGLKKLINNNEHSGSAYHTSVSVLTSWFALFLKIALSFYHDSHCPFPYKKILTYFVYVLVFVFGVLGCFLCMYSNLYLCQMFMYIRMHALSLPMSLLVWSTRVAFRALVPFLTAVLWSTEWGHHVSLSILVLEGPGLCQLSASKQPFAKWASSCLHVCVWRCLHDRLEDIYINICPGAVMWWTYGQSG